MKQKKITLRNQINKDYACEVIQLFDLEKTGDLVCTISELKNKRSEAQNNLYHMWVAFIAKEYWKSGQGHYTTKVWRVHFRQMFLGYVTEEMPNGKKVENLISSADLNVAPFTEYLDHIDNYVASDGGIYVPYPQHMYYEAMKKEGKR